MNGELIAAMWLVLLFALLAFVCGVFQGLGYNLADHIWGWK